MHGPAAAGIVAALYGCIPLLLTDHLHEAYEPELPWSSFSLRLPQNRSAWLHEELAGQSGGQVERWQVGRGRLDSTCCALNALLAVARC